MDYILVEILGLVIGSFLNVCICRIPKEESIVFPPSHCTNCDHELGRTDMIPILSYILLGGKCKYCKKRISIRYPSIEFLNSVLYLIVYYKYGLTLIALKYCILVSLLIVIGMIDYDTQFVFTSTIIFAVIVAVIFTIIQAVYYRNGSLDLILGGVAGLGIIGLIVFFTKGMGEGDIEIAAVCGLFLGIKGILLGLFLAIVLGGIVGIVILALKLRKAKDKIAFGPCIAIGSLISMLWGVKILQTYCNLFVK